MRIEFKEPINFMGLRVLAIGLSIAMMLGTFSLLSTKGLNFGIDFTGGTLIEIQTETPADINTLRQTLGGLSLGDVSIQEFGEPTDLIIRLAEQPGETDEEQVVAQQTAVDKVKASLESALPTPPEYRRIEYVGPQVGDELIKKGLYALIFSMIGILAYVAIRFEWRFGVAAIIALLHDAIITLGFFALIQKDFNLSTVAAVLMISGYSINDTVVVFDRIRENLRKYKKMELKELLNRAVTETLSRTIMTSFTTLLALIALFFLGGEVIQSFVDALIFGILIGTYSSIFVAAPLLYMLNVRRAFEPNDIDRTPEEFKEQ